MGSWHDVGGVDEAGEDEVTAVSPGGTPVALFRYQGEFFALYDRCSHGQAKLSDGWIEDGNVECPLHQGLICIRTGEPRSQPVKEPVRTYPVRIVGDRIEIEI